jgi:GxxExxY protein
MFVPRTKPARASLRTANDSAGRIQGSSPRLRIQLDLLVESTVILELKCVERVTLIHEAQLLTYMKLLNKPVGFIINFNVPVLKAGIVRKVL